MDLVDFIIQFVVHLSDSAQLEVSLLTQVFEVVHDEGELSLLLHAAIDLLSHLRLVILLLLVNSVPGLILDSLTRLFELRDHALNFFR